MRKIIFVYICDREVGEVEGVFDVQGNLLHWWNLNDANWRHEYFDPLMETLFIEVEASSDEKLEKKLAKAVLRSLMGL